MFAIVAENLGADKAQLRIAAENGPMFAVQYEDVYKRQADRYTLILGSVPDGLIINLFWPFR